MTVPHPSTHTHVHTWLVLHVRRGLRVVLVRAFMSRVQLCLLCACVARGSTHTFIIHYPNRIGRVVINYTSAHQDIPQRGNYSTGSGAAIEALRVNRN